MIKIYALICPISKEIRYIGITRYSLEKRLKEHIGENKTKTHKQKWIQSLVKNNLCPSIVLIDIADNNSWVEKEKFYIKLFKENGFRLTNTSEGGEGGGNKNHNHTNEWKIKASERMKERNKLHPLGKEFYEKLNSKKRKKVQGVDKFGNKKEYKSISSAAEDFFHLQKNKSKKQTATSISNCLNKRSKTAWGYSWSYI